MPGPPAPAYAWPVGTGNTILYWYGACTLVVLVCAAVIAALTIVGRRRKSARYRTRSLDPSSPEE